MGKLPLKILAGLCFWLLSAQSIAAFTLAGDAHQVSEDPGFRYTQSASPKLFYQQINIFKIEPAPQDRVPLLQSPLISPAYRILGRVLTDIPSEGYAFRDQKYSLKILVFPFHSFW